MTAMKAISSESKPSSSVDKLKESLHIPHGFYHEYVYVAGKINTKIRKYAFSVFYTFYVYLNMTLILLIQMSPTTLPSVLIFLALISMVILFPYMNLERAIHEFLCDAKDSLFLSYGRVLDRLGVKLLSPSSDEELQESSAEIVSSLTAILQDLKDLKTWSFDTTSMSILTVSFVIPVVVSIVTTLVLNFLGT